MVAIYAHRGASVEFPENTMAAFRRALELGVEGIELDVHVSSDGVPVVIHDDSVDRTTNGSGKVSELTVEQLQRLDAGNGETIPTLGEVLDLVGDRLHVDIEIKANDAADAVLRELDGRDTRWLISSFRWDVLKYVRSRDEDAELWVLTVGASDDAIAVLREVNASALAIDHRGLDDDIAAFLADEGIRFWPWTVNDVERAKQCVEWGAIGICTDDPATLQQAFGQATPEA